MIGHEMKFCGKIRKNVIFSGKNRLNDANIYSSNCGILKEIRVVRTSEHKCLGLFFVV